MMNCNCENRFLPTDGELDSMPLDHEELPERQSVLVLWPSEWTACGVCNPAAWMNEDLECRV